MARAADPPRFALEVVERNDGSAEGLIRAQVTAPGSRWLGGSPDQYNMHSAGPAGGLIETLTASFLCGQSRFYRNGALLERIRLAAGFLERSQSAEGFIDLLSTNFNSPPDTGFVVHNVATAASVAKRYGNDEIVSALRPFLVRAADGMSLGGVHTPNHRWVVSSALAQVNEVYPKAAYVRRAEQWLAEGIDIDSDGQYTERSTVTYNTVVNRALVVMAVKLSRPELLNPVRRNLEAMQYLVHPDGEVVTEVSRRQDQFSADTMRGYWFSLLYLAAKDSDGRWAALGKNALQAARLSALMEYPELADGFAVKASALPEDYLKTFPEMGLIRVRRGRRDATVVTAGNSRFFSMRNGSAVVQAVRFASSFFGKGQFIPDRGGKVGDGFVLSQLLEAPYYQPLEPAQRVTPANWGALVGRRRRTQVCRLEQSATVREVEGGFELRLQVSGTAGVPVAVEIALREGGQLEGCRAAPGPSGGMLLESGYATYRRGGDSIRFGPGAGEHWETQLRGSLPRLPGVSVYLTGFSPFDRTIRFEG